MLYIAFNDTLKPTLHGCPTRLVNAGCCDKSYKNKIVGIAHSTKQMDTIKKAEKKGFFLIILILACIWFFFYHLYSYKADIYSKNLYLGMSREKAEKVIPVEIFSRNGYPHPMSKRPKNEYGWFVSWKFEDGSILKADFNELSGLQSFTIDKADTFAGNFPAYILAGTIYLLIALYLLEKNVKTLSRNS